MATPPGDVRAGVSLVAAAAAAEVAAVVTEVSSQPLPVLLDAVPSVIDFYLDGVAELALQWYEELRAEVETSRPFSPEPLVVAKPLSLRDELRASSERIAAEIDADYAALMSEQAALITEAHIADGFRGTILGNAERDPEAVGWRRFARPGACKFCQMLAHRGAVYSFDTARFAAHAAVVAGGRKGGNCMCTAGPAFRSEPDWEAATPMQYVASSRKRSAGQRAALREYLTHNFPDAPG